LRKYLQEQGPGYSEEPQIQESLETSEAEGSSTASTAEETQSVETRDEDVVASPQSVLSFSGPVNAAAPAATPLRRGFLKQLLSRFSSGEG
jgi:hypothetical protein